MEQVCPKCHEPKPSGQFYSKTGSKYHYCLSCRRQYYKGWQAGRSENPVPDKCQICGVVFDDENCSPHFDHDHVTNIFRGWLCRQCNIGVGMFKDNPSLMRAAAAYIEVRNARNAALQMRA